MLLTGFGLLVGILFVFFWVYWLFVLLDTGYFVCCRLLSGVVDLLLSYIMGCVGDFCWFAWF